MSALFGSKPPANTTPDYTGLQIQTAVSTLPVPIIWGMARAAPNLIWYQNFQVHSGGGGGGGKGGFFSNGNQQNSYSADIILAMCEGQIVSINNVEVGGAKQFGELVAKLDLSKPAALLVRSGDQSRYVIVRPSEH